MTAIAGLVHDGRVLVGADSAGVGGWTLTIRKDAKVFANGPYVMGFTTSFRMGQILCWSFKPPPPGKGSLERFMCTTWVDTARKALSEGGWATKEVCVARFICCGRRLVGARCHSGRTHDRPTEDDHTVGAARAGSGRLRGQPARLQLGAADVGRHRGCYPAHRGAGDQEAPRGDVAVGGGIMTDLQATLDAIAQVAVHQCGYCSRPLSEGSESPDYCGPVCQQAWVSERQQIIELVGYDEPGDLPEHAWNQVELYSPEVMPPGGWVADLRYRFTAVSSVRIAVDTSQLTGALERAEEGFRRLGERMAEAGEAFARVSRGVSADWVIFDEIHDWHPIGLINSARITTSDVARVFDVPEELITRCPEPFGSDYDFTWRPTPGLYGALKPAVMPEAAARDWQALVDARVSHTGPVRRVRAPRQLGRTR